MVSDELIQWIRKHGGTVGFVALQVIPDITKLKQSRFEPRWVQCGSLLSSFDPDHFKHQLHKFLFACPDVLCFEILRSPVL